MKGMKKAISAVLTVLTTAALAATVYAAEYRTTPPVSNAAPSVSVSTSNAKDAISGAIAAGETVSGTASVTVNSTVSLPVSSSVIRALKASGDAVLEIVSPKATITIDASTIKKVGKIDLSCKVYGTASRNVVDFRSTKNFNCEVKIAITSNKMSAAKLANAHLYLDGEDLGTDLIEIDENGVPVITVTKGGKYEIK